MKINRKNLLISDPEYNRPELVARVMLPHILKILLREDVTDFLC